MHTRWTDAKPTKPGRWALRWKENPRAWQIVTVCVFDGSLYADGLVMEHWSDGYQWSDKPYPEPLEPKE